MLRGNIVVKRGNGLGINLCCLEDFNTYMVASVSGIMQF